MAYETISSVNYGTTAVTAQSVRSIPQSPDALGDLGRASTEYANVAAAFIEARHALDEAREYWNACRDKVAKLLEAEGV